MGAQPMRYHINSWVNIQCFTPPLDWRQLMDVPFIFTVIVVVQVVLMTASIAFRYLPAHRASAPGESVALRIKQS